MEEQIHHEHKVAEAEKKQLAISVQQAILWGAIIISVAIIFGAYVIHGSFSVGGNDSGVGVTRTQTSATAVNIASVKTAGEPYIGDPSAKVAIAYWSDYQCPYCKRFETTTFQDIVNKYVSTGKVVVYFKDFAFLGSDSDTAALYARAVWSLYPDQYFTWRTALYNAQDGENTGFGDEASVVKLTSTISGIDVSKVQDAVKRNRIAYMNQIDADKAEGAALGIQGTPSFVTGTQLLQGLTDYATFANALDKQL